MKMGLIRILQKIEISVCKCYQNWENHGGESNRMRKFIEFHEFHSKFTQNTCTALKNIPVIWQNSFPKWENWEIRQNKGILKACLLTIRFTIFFQPIFQTFRETIFWVRHF